jgi:hypothetical protein
MKTRTANILIIVLILTACLAAVSSWLITHLATTATGMEWGSIMVEKDGKYYVTYRGGGPIEERTLTPITKEQYLTRKKYYRIATPIGLVGVMCWFTAMLWFIIRAIIQLRKGEKVPLLFWTLKLKE